MADHKTGREQHSLDHREDLFFMAQQEFLRGVALFRDGHYEQSLVCYNKCIELNPNHAIAHNGKGVALNNINRYEEAIICFNKCIELDPNHGDAYNNKGYALNNLNRNEEAIICFNKCIELNPNHAIAYNNKGLALNDLNRYEQSLVCYNKCIELDPNHANAYNGKGLALNNLNRNEEAIISLNKCIELNPNHANAYNNKGAALRNLNRYEDAMACFNKCIELNPNHGDAYNGKGLALNNLNRYEEAIISLNKCIELNPNHAIAYNNKGAALRNLNRYEDAMACFNKCIELKPNHAIAYNNKGSALNNLNRYEEAIISLNKCIELNPNHAIAYNNKGLALNDLNRYEDAILSFNKCIELDPNYVNAYNNKGYTLDGLNRDEEALVCFNKCIELDPNYPKAYNNKRIALKKLHGSEDGAILIVKYLFEGQEKEVRVDIVDLERICLQNSITFSLEGGQSEVAVSRVGLAEMRRLGEGSGGLDEIGCLQIAMTKDRRVSDLLKRRILFGLLFAREGERGLRVIKEDGLIVAPSFEIQVPVPVSSLPGGTISFLTDLVARIPHDPPDVFFLCHQKSECGIPIHQMIGFVLEELKKLPPSETLMDDRFNFRLKSYSSIMNKLLYRGKELTDLLATTVSTDAELDAVKTALEERGGIEIPGDLNGNDCLVYRYVRILLVSVGAKELPFPVYYEIVQKNFLTARVPHEQYQLDRLEFSLNDEHMNILDSHGFTFETPR